MIQPRLHPERLHERRLVPALTLDKAKRLRGHLPTDGWFDLVERADQPSICGYKPDGSLLYVVLRGALSAGALQSACDGQLGFDPKLETRTIAVGRDGAGRSLLTQPAVSRGLRSLNHMPDNRGDAVGRDGLGRTLRAMPASPRAAPRYRSRTNKVPPHVLRHLRIGVSGTVGFMDRGPRYPFCRGCSGNGRNNERLRAVVPLAREVEQIFAYAVPERFAQQRSIADRTRPDWLIGGTCFTTVTVNKNFQCGTHQDAGDYKPGFTNLVMIRSGRFTGGYLVLPAWRAAIELNTGDALFFDPHEWHGTSPIRGLHQRYERMTLVMYYRTGMAKCGSPAEELQHGRRKAQVGDMR